ncbi:hypothetical protein HOT81_gp086 [Gordonia phage Fryberger]|nr:hypothetical protein HOT81_gp086 [Gordonia phage Fryberger]AXN53503.1 hypothetical protein SEA_FRYBERGER_86 [Gordonia phage Fryberger]QHB38206.1 hypothetical protein SEA_VOLT_90 [Gordonia phage Volt]
MLPNIKLGFSTQERLENTGWLAGGLFILASTIYFTWFLFAFWGVNGHDIPTYLEVLSAITLIPFVIGVVCIVGGICIGIGELVSDWHRSLPYDDEH